MFDYADIHYFDECLRDQAMLWIPAIVKRCASIVPNTQYPDAQPTFVYQEISVTMDVREIPMQEIAHSGGLLLTGDLMTFTKFQLRGPKKQAHKHDVGAVADVVHVYDQDFYVVGFPQRGIVRAEVAIGCSAYIRRVRT